MALVKAGSEIRFCLFSMSVNNFSTILTRKMSSLNVQFSDMFEFLKIMFFFKIRFRFWCIFLQIFLDIHALFVCHLKSKVPPSSRLIFDASSFKCPTTSILVFVASFFKGASKFAPFMWSELLKKCHEFAICLCCIFLKTSLQFHVPFVLPPPSNVHPCPGNACTASALKSDSNFILSFCCIFLHHSTSTPLLVLHLFSKLPSSPRHICANKFD